MTLLTEPMVAHHKHCDDLFVTAETAVAGQTWLLAESALTRFIAELETHFRAEEETLFPAFEAATGMSGGPTQMMRHEHAQMRDLLGQMRSAVAQRAAQAFAGAAETLLILMQQHNMKEENILYPMCNNSLGSQADGLSGRLREKLGSPCLQDAT